MEYSDSRISRQEGRVGQGDFAIARGDQIKSFLKPNIPSIR